MPPHRLQKLFQLTLFQFGDSICSIEFLEGLFFSTLISLRDKKSYGFLFEKNTPFRKVKLFYTLDSHKIIAILAFSAANRHQFIRVLQIIVQAKATCFVLQTIKPGVKLKTCAFNPR